MGREFNEGKPRMWVVLLLRGGVSPKLFTFHLISCTDCKTKLFSTASVKNVSETLKITVTVLNCRWCVRRWNRCCANTICFDLHIELGHKKKKKRLNHDMIVQKISSSWSQLMLCWKRFYMQHLNTSTV